MVSVEISLIPKGKWNSFPRASTNQKWSKQSDINCIFEICSRESLWYDCFWKAPKAPLWIIYKIRYWSEGESNPTRFILKIAPSCLRKVMSQFWIEMERINECSCQMCCCSYCHSSFWEQNLPPSNFKYWHFKININYKYKIW